MAGTRLYIQGLVFVELLSLALWSFYFGFCHGDDLLCRRLLDLVSLRGKPMDGLPQLESPHKLPVIQVDKQLLPKTPFEWKKNPNAIIVCSQPESPVVQGQIVWWCPSTDTEPRLVIRGSSLLVFGKEKHLVSQLKPEVNSYEPFQVTLHLVFEEMAAKRAQSFAFTMQDDVNSLSFWPNVKDVKVEMSVAPPQTDDWRILQTLESTNGESQSKTVPSKLSDTNARKILENLNLSYTGHDLIVYVPSTEPEEMSVFEIDSNQLLMVGGWEVSFVQQWLARSMGIPTDNIDSDGTFPQWYEEWYWYSASQELAKQVQARYTESQEFIECPLLLTESSSSWEFFKALQGLNTSLMSIKNTTMKTDIPLEQYAAIFAPLLFPLLVPFMTALVKEFRRYKEKRKAKGSTTQKVD